MNSREAVSIGAGLVSCSYLGECAEVESAGGRYGDGDGAWREEEVGEQAAAPMFCTANSAVFSGTRTSWKTYDVSLRFESAALRSLICAFCVARNWILSWSRNV